MTFGEKLSKLRKERNKTREQLAESLGVSSYTVKEWEDGSKYPKIDMMFKISEILNCSVNYLRKDDTGKSVLSNNAEETPSATEPTTDEKPSNEEKPSTGKETKHKCNDKEDEYRFLTTEEAENFLKNRNKNWLPIALARFFLVMSLVCAILLKSAVAEGYIGLSISAVHFIGLGVAVFLIALSVFICYIVKKYSEDYFDIFRGKFRTQADLTEFIRSEKQEYREKYEDIKRRREIVLFVAFIIVIVASFFSALNNFVMSVIFCIAWTAVAIEESIFLKVEMKYNSYRILLKDHSTLKVYLMKTLTMLFSGAFFLICSSACLPFDDWNEVWSCFILPMYTMWKVFLADIIFDVGLKD